MGGALSVYLQKKPEEEWRGDIETIKRVIAVIEPYREQLKPFSNLVKFRNNLNHSEMNIERISAQNIERTIVEFVSEMKPFFQKVANKIVLAEGTLLS